MFDMSTSRVKRHPTRRARPNGSHLDYLTCPKAFRAIVVGLHSLVLLRAGMARAGDHGMRADRQQRTVHPG